MKMKHFSRALIALILAALTAMTLPAQVFAAGTNEKYISEVQIGVGKSASEAEKSLDGYEILKDDNGNNVDLNKNAGATGVGGKGNRVVYLGFKKTADSKQAITDLAVMNMKGGYSVEDYEALMESQMKDQIIPFVESFVSAIEEYRANCKSSNPANKARATYIRDILNKYTDDDCDGAGLGDLLLNETKYEMGDEAYNALSAAEKKKHADILTVIAQSNGQATLMMQNLITRAADTGEDTWVDRIADVTYQDLLDDTDLPPSKAKKELDLEYSDDALVILSMWDAFKAQLDGYDDAVAKLEEITSKDMSKQQEIIDKYNIETATDEETAAYAEAVAEVQQDAEIISNCYADILCKEFLEGIEYGDSTLLEFFTTPASEIEKDMTVLYPIIAALSPGQRSGLEFITLQELVMIGSTDEKGYADAKLDDMETNSIYMGVDREIYKKGGVALTSDALRTKAVEKMNSENDPFILSIWTCTMIGLTALSATAFGICARAKVTTVRAIGAINKSINEYNASVTYYNTQIKSIKYNFKQLVPSEYASDFELVKIAESKAKLQLDLEAAQANLKNLKAPNNKAYLSRLEAKSTMCSKMMIGFGIAMIILLSVTAYLTYQDMVNRYKVDFTPIPRYMVDEKDITGYNVKGEKIVIKNQAAYYKAALCNRTGGDYYGTVGNIGDLNGYVGKQWLALYAAKNEAEAPILASSFKFTGSAEIPSGYKTGIHSFGTDAAENLNNTLYVWNSSAPKVYVYFKAEEAPASTAGSNFTTGTVVLSGICGLAIGVLVSVIIIKAAKKKRISKTETI